MLKAIWAIGGDAFDVIYQFLGLFSNDAGIKKSTNSLENFGAKMDSLSRRFTDFVNKIRENEDIAGMIFGAMAGGTIGGPLGAGIGAIIGGTAGAYERHKYFSSGDAYAPNVHLTEGARTALGLGPEKPYSPNQWGIGDLPRGAFQGFKRWATAGTEFDIARQESHGNYTARNPQSGAFGKYQIMPENWPQWAKDAGLGANAPMTPQNQEMVARTRLAYYMKEYGGNEQLVAAAWYGGEGAANRLRKGDLKALDIGPRAGMKGPTIGQYIEQVTGAQYGRKNGGGSQTIDASIGDIHVSVSGTNLSADEVANKVYERLVLAQSMNNQRLQYGLGGVWR